ncbi:MAG: CxxxxCH/CxxCH domain-containing protein [Candidatus Latescibacteria bacterium]|nr:CxxxxCH/CxxCH domain-containing protein [Candidatus Latescibacterota bacterium]
MKRGALVLALLLGWCWWSGCSEVREDAALPTGPAAKVHVDGWADLSTGRFLHAEEIEENQGNTTSCQRCHGADYQGKGEEALSCLNCHADPAKGVIHPAGWADLQTGQFLHAQQLRQNGGSTASCQGCHGQNYAGGVAAKTSCLTCHADPAKGVIHPEGWLNPAAKETFHGEAIRTRNWDMSGCQSCHGADYAGGIVQNSCLTCHAGTPESCTTCHGSSEGIAPPEDTQGNRETSFYGVGAHQAHLGQGSLSAALNCIDCHHFPQGFADPAHIDGDGRAELSFGARASANGSVPAYDPQANTCAGTYCHSGGKMGSQAVPVWTEVGSGQAACGTCHGLPPAQETGHPPVVAPLTCATCHSRVVDADNIIIDATLHLNGQTDF